MKITIENFNSNNRSKTIGNSLFRICREADRSGKWYIYECFNDGKDFATNKAHYNDDLQMVIDIFNNISREKEIISLKY